MVGKREQAMTREQLREIIVEAVWWGAREWDAYAVPAASEAADRAMEEIAKLERDCE